MPTVHITDTTQATADLNLEDKSPLGQSKLQELAATTDAVVGGLQNPVDQSKIKNATLGASFAAPTITLATGRTLALKAGVNAAMCVFLPKDKKLFGDDAYALEIAIAPDQSWMSFELDATFDATLNNTISAGTMSGFGVSVAGSAAAKFTCYTLFGPGGPPLPSGKDCLATTLSNFKFLTSAVDVRDQKPGTVHVCDITGSIKFTGTYTIPMAANALALASLSTAALKLGSQPLPFNYTLSVKPNFKLQVSGSVTLSGEHSIRCYKVSDTEAQIGVYKKKGTTLSAAFDAAAGVLGSTGKGDIFGPFFNAVAPKVDPRACGLKDQDCALIEKALQQNIDQSLSVCLNLACSASFADEAAFVYRVQLDQNQAGTDAALEAAFRGDWTALQNLPNATELRNVLGETKDSKHNTVVHLLGVFNYQSLEDFIGNCTVVHNPEGCSLSITDRQTASRFSVATMPYLADDKRLRDVLNEACVVTMTYAAAGAGANLTSDLKITQNYLVYEDQLDAKSIHKGLLSGVALHLMSSGDWQNLLPTTPTPRHVRLAGDATFDGPAALQLFFSDVATRTPRALPDLKLLGRRVLLSLLDPGNPIDMQRMQNLNDDATWAQMDRQEWTLDLQRLSYPDWMDITGWADAISAVGPSLKIVLEALDSLPAGQDPTQNPDFTKKRANLASALGSAASKCHAANEKGWPIAVLYALSNFKAARTFSAAWDGQVHFDQHAEAPAALTAQP